MVKADHFINLIDLNKLGYPEKIELSNGDFITFIDLDPSLEEVLKETPGVEPGDN